jgi:hypothetical protein
MLTLYSAKPVNRTLKAVQHTLSAHDFEHVIKAGSNRPAADGYSSRVNKFTGFTSQPACCDFSALSAAHRPILRS